MQNATQAEIALEDVGGRIEQVEDLHQRCQGQQQAQGLRQQHPTQIRRQWPFHGLWTLRLRCRNELPSMTRSTLATRRVSGLSPGRSEEHTSELQSLMRISYAVFCLKK